MQLYQQLLLPGCQMVPLTGEMVGGAAEHIAGMSTDGPQSPQRNLPVFISHQPGGQQVQIFLEANLQVLHLRNRTSGCSLQNQLQFGIGHPLPAAQQDPQSSDGSLFFCNQIHHPGVHQAGISLIPDRCPIFRQPAAADFHTEKELQTIGGEIVHHLMQL